MPRISFLFNNALDPFLNLMHNTLRKANHGIARACADDIGVCLTRLKHLSLLYPVFQSSRDLAGLKLKPQKCVLVPLCQFNETTKKNISKWLKRNIPEWCNFSIEDSTKLLGFFIGPGAGRMSWTEQASKMRSRVRSIQHAEASVKLNTHTFNTRVVPVTSYIAQLLVIPDSFSQLERAMMHTVLRLPQNALCHADFMHLHKVGGPNFRSMVTASVAALVSTALKTITSWPDWIRQLAVAADQWLPLEPLVREKLCTNCWDSPPIACNLREASLGFPNHHQWSKALADILVSPKFRAPFDSVNIQKAVYNQLVSHRFGYSLDDTIMRRLTKLFHPFTLDFKNSIILERCWCILRKNRVSDVIKVLKCWCNGWATSRRYHDDKLLPCLLGCVSCQDSLEHYLQCPHLYALWSFLAGSASPDPLKRWGLIDPEGLQFKYVCCVFSGYHALRRESRRTNEFFEYNQTKLTGTQLRIFWSVFANTFSVEAGELSIYCTQFSLPSFLTMLNSHPARPSCLTDHC